MKIRSRSTALVFASALGAIAAMPLAARAADPLPGQPGADTSVSAVTERSAPYMVMLVRANGQTTQREVSAKTAAELMKTAKPVADGMMVLVHSGKAYIVQDMVMHGGPYDGQSVMKVLYSSMP
jgi:hypothetical protein